VTGLRQVSLQVFAEFEARVVGPDMDAHTPSLEVACDTDAGPATPECLAQMSFAGLTKPERQRLRLDG
jgi:hypothetical protein